VAEVFARPAHDYTRMLLATEPRGRPPAIAAEAPEILRTENLRVHFPIRRGVLRRVVATVKAVNGVTLSVPLPLLGALSARRCEWLVPGMLKDKVLSLLKTLHQRPRSRGVMALRARY